MADTALEDGVKKGMAGITKSLNAALAGGYLLLAGGYVLAGASIFNRRNSGVPANDQTGAKYEINRLYDAAGPFGNASMVLAGISDIAAAISVLAWILLVVSEAFRASILSTRSEHPRTNAILDCLYALTHITFIVADPSFINYLPDMSEANSFYLAVFPILCAMLGVAGCFALMGIGMWLR